MGLFHWGIGTKKSTGKPRLGMESLEDRITPTVSFVNGPNSPIAIGTGTTPNSVVVADFNGDGVDDIATANNTSNNVSVLLGSTNEDGSFQSPIFTAVGTAPVSLAAADVNGDNIQDLITANNTPTNNLSVLIGNGDGTFETAVNYNAGVLPSFVGAADFSGDKIPDLAVADFTSGTVNILINAGNGTGTFGAFTSYTVGAGPDSIAVADFNGDKVLDLAVANANSNNVSILIGEGLGTFAANGTLSVNTKPVSIVAGDFNNDGKVDLATLNQTDNNISVMVGFGTGSFAAATTEDVLFSNSIDMTTADFNADGKLDLAVANVSNNAVIVLQGNGDATFQTGQAFSTLGQSPAELAVGDFNNDGLLDITTANSASNNVSAILGYAPGAAVTSATNVTTPATSYQFTVTYADSRTPINVSTISGSNVVVVGGPNNVTLTATLVSINSNTNGSPRSAVYQITPPGGEWDINDSGDYVINILADQVKNTDGVAVHADTIGGFRVSITNALNNLGVGYVNGLYQSILGRTGDTAGLTYWNGKLDGGAAKDTLFIGFWVSREHRTLQVQGYYRDFLHREADAVGLSFWVAKFAQGASELDVIQGFMGSMEYRNINGGTATSVITGIYNDLLGRAPSASEIQIWVSAFNSSGSAAVAKGVVQSAEYQMDLVSNDYTVFLNRPLIAQSEIDANLAVIKSKGPISEQDLALKFAVSSEFINLTLETVPT